MAGGQGTQYSLPERRIKTKTLQLHVDSGMWIVGCWPGAAAGSRRNSTRQAVNVHVNNLLAIHISCGTDNRVKTTHNCRERQVLVYALCWR